MRKNSPKEKSQRLRASVVRGVLALVMVGLLVVPIAVHAELKATSLAYTWDLSAGEWEWGHATVEWDGAWIPLLQEVYFDHLDRPPGLGEPDICPGVSDPERTQYAGWIEYGLPYLDTDPPDARGFQDSDEWIVVDCDLDRDGDWDRDDLLVAPGDVPEENILAECTEGGKNCNILYQDEVQDCGVATAEHCAQELATMLLISIDTDCDGEVDEDAVRFTEATALCVFSWALTPELEAGEAMWTFPLPVRITDADGAKTLMLYPNTPTAVELAAFNAEPQGSTVLVSWETATEMDNLGFNLFRSWAGGERIRLNDRLIASQSPGSTVGSSYQFVDRSAEPGMAYQYWLEDIDLGGVANMNGPVAVQMPRHRLLPCRPRPAPMPAGYSQ